MKHLLKSASVAGIVVGLGLFAGAAFAQQTVSGNNDKATQDITSYNVPITADNGNNQSTNVSKDNGNNQSTNITKDNGNTKTITADNGNNESTNINKDDGNNQSTNISKDNGNNQSTHLAVNKDDNNNQSTNVNKDDGNNQSTNNSGNTSTTVGNVTLAVGYSDLTGSVSGQSFKGGSGSGDISSGALSLSGNALQGFAGINTGTYITGQGSLGQATNAVTATSSVTFQ